jgi:hypothetical protein
MWKKGRGTTKWKLGDVDAEHGPFDKLPRYAGQAGQALRKKLMLCVMATVGYAMPDDYVLGKDNP